MVAMTEKVTPLANCELCTVGLTGTEVTASRGQLVIKQQILMLKTSIEVNILVGIIIIIIIHSF